VIIGLHQSELAAFSGFIASLVVNIILHLNKKPIRLLQIATIFFFAALSVVSLFVDLEEYVLFVRISAGLLPASIVLFSIFFKKPLAFQYLSKNIPQEIKKSSRFKKGMYIISWGWFLAFLLQLIIPIIRILGSNPPKILGLFVPMFTILAVIKFTVTYLRRISSR